MILAIDPGRHMGVCRVPARERQAIVHGENLYTIKLKDTTDLGLYLRSAQDPLRELLAGCTDVYVERPNTERQHYTAIRKNMALLSFTAYWATFYGVAFHEVNVAHVKGILTDSGNAKKEFVMERAEYLLGLPAGALTEHEADAFGVWMVASYGPPQKAADRQKAFTARKRAEKEAAKAAARGAVLL